MTSTDDRWQARRWFDASDAELVAAYCRNSGGEDGRQAASVLMERYRRLVLCWCRRYVQDREGALDLAQDVLLNAFRNLDRYREEERFSAWLFIITRNRCLSELRRRRVPVGDESVWEWLADPAGGPDEQLANKETGEELRRTVARILTDQERDALWLRCYEGVPLAAIATRLDLETGDQARVVLQRARRKLRRALGDRQGDWLEGRT